MRIQRHLKWTSDSLYIDGEQIHQLPTSENTLSRLTDLYKKLNLNYPKFFKMDILCKSAFLASEIIIPELKAISLDKIAVVLSTHSGCLEVDKNFEASRANIASPALFVYTLPNIMLGEICIRHKFKGEQMCTIEPKFNPEWFSFYVTDLLLNRATDACLCGHVETTEDHIDIELFWVTKEFGEQNHISFKQHNQVSND